MIKKIVLFIILAALTAQAGVRTVGNGGGFGEMKAYLAFQQMGSQIQICLSLATICNLTNEQKTLLSGVEKALPIEKRLGGVQFFNDPSLQRTVETEPRVGALILLNSNLLTSRTGVAETLSKISTLVLFGLLQHQSGKMPLADLWVLAEAVFAKFQENVLTSAYSIDTNRILLHRLRFSEIKTSRLIYESLLIEDQAKTYDLILTSGLEKMCPAKSQFSTKILSLSPGSLGMLTVQVAWSCDLRNWGRASLYYHFRVDTNTGLIVVPFEKSIKGVVAPTGVGGYRP